MQHYLVHADTEVWEMGPTTPGTRRKNEKRKHCNSFLLNSMAAIQKHRVCFRDFFFLSKHLVMPTGISLFSEIKIVYPTIAAAIGVFSWQTNQRFLALVSNAFKAFIVFFHFSIGSIKEVLWTVNGEEYKKYFNNILHNILLNNIL